MKTFYWILAGTMAIAIALGDKPQTATAKVETSNELKRPTLAAVTPPARPKTKPAGWQPVKMRLTAYCNEGAQGCRTCNGKWAKYNQTASGKTPKWGMVAADPKLLPFGTKVWIPGLGQFAVEDTGSAIKGRRLDLFFGRAPGAHQRARQFGAPTVMVWVQKPKP